MRRALVVGIDDYKDAPLHGCVNDATSIAAVLGTHGDGAPNFAVRLLTSPPTPITRRALREAIEQLFSGDCDVALLHFSGHGMVGGGGGVVVTTDFERYDEGVSMDEILTLATKSRVKDRVILLDCCHSGAMGSPSVTSGTVAQVAEGLTVLTSSRADEAAREADGWGVFTRLVVDALNGGAADLRGHVTPGSIYSYVDQALGAWDQRPIFKTNITRFTSLRMVPPPIPLGTLRKLCVYFSSPQAEHQLDPSYEFTEKAADPMKVDIFKDLQTFAAVGLVVPVGEEHMYFAAMNSKSCRLTALGYHYWRLADEKKL